MPYVIRDVDTGIEISRHETREEALETMDFYDDYMKQVGLYEEGRYELFDEEE